MKVTSQICRKTLSDYTFFTREICRQISTFLIQQEEINDAGDCSTPKSYYAKVHQLLEDLGQMPVGAPALTDLSASIDAPILHHHTFTCLSKHSVLS